MHSTQPTKKQRTVAHLQALYVVGAGLGMAIALGGMLKGELGNVSVDKTSVALAFAYLVTLVPFFHGAMLFMDTDLPRRGAAALMTNFMALFSQTVLFFVMAELVREPTWFARAWLALLLVDITWSVWLIWRPGAGLRSIPVWARINLVCSVMLGLLLLADDRGFVTGLELAFLLAGVGLIRTLADYWFSRDFYFMD